MESFHARMAEAGRRAGRADIDGKADARCAGGLGRASSNRCGVVRDEYRRTRRDLKDHRRQGDARRSQAAEGPFAARAPSSPKWVPLTAKGFVERASWVERRHECQGLLDIGQRRPPQSGGRRTRTRPSSKRTWRAFDAAHEPKAHRVGSPPSSSKFDREPAGRLRRVGRPSSSRSSRSRPTARRRGCDSKRSQTPRTSWPARPRNGSASSWRGRPSTAFARSSSATCQPATLALASKYLEKLTRGRYRNVWTPLGQRELRVDDERGPIALRRAAQPRHARAAFPGRPHGDRARAGTRKASTCRWSSTTCW